MADLCTLVYALFRSSHSRVHNLLIHTSPNNLTTAFETSQTEESSAVGSTT